MDNFFLEVMEVWGHYVWKKITHRKTCDLSVELSKCKELLNANSVEFRMIGVERYMTLMCSQAISFGKQVQRPP